ncbi:MAG: SRPBCC family protein [Thaumarchaeota archaeon]|nr:SRPBCC family protein [Nitrososphaerota archaeon]
MTNIKGTYTIDAQPDKIWQTLKSFGNVEVYLPMMVKKTDLSGSGVGAVRTCTLIGPDGSIMPAKNVERLEYVNDSEKVMKFSFLEGPFPVSDCVVSVKVGSAENNQTRLDIESNLAPKGVSEKEITKMFFDVYGTISQGLEKLHKN